MSLPPFLKSARPFAGSSPGPGPRRRLRPLRRETIWPLLEKCCPKAMAFATRRYLPTAMIFLWTGMSGERQLKRKVARPRTLSAMWRLDVRKPESLRGSLRSQNQALRHDRLLVLHALEQVGRGLPVHEPPKKQVPQPAGLQKHRWCIFSYFNHSIFGLVVNVQNLGGRLKSFALETT